MSFDIKYQKNKLVLEELECECGLKHRQPDMDIYIGPGILANSVEYIEEAITGERVLVITDNVVNDYAQEFIEIIENEGYDVKICLLERKEELVPDQRALGEILLVLEPDIDFLCAVGSGSLNDLTRYIAFNTDRPFVSVGTAPSMDGYTSVIAPLIYNELKVNKPAQNPEVLICDLDIMKKAPYEMLISGFGDVIGKYISLADWKLGKIVNGEQYCPAAAEITMQAVNKCVDNVEGIIERTEKGIRSLIEALILAGLTILIIDNTRAVSSIEHGMGHYLEMMKLLRGEKPARHGITVGVMTGYAVRIYEDFLNLDLEKVALEEIKSQRKTRAEWEQQIRDKYGARLGPSILEKNSAGHLSWTEQKRRIETVCKNFAQIKQEVDFLPSLKELISLYRKLEFPLSAKEINIDDQLMKDALLYGKDYRERYTVFKTMDELGVLEKYVAEIY
ncbi:MAG: sn-glycerol-1-phosphate dehydrogenase [Bacillota bacterium]